MEKDDIILIEETINGDTDSFAVLIDRYKDSIFNFIYRMTGNRHDAEDLSQEVFLKAYKNLDKFKAEYKFYTWLYTIAGNVCKNHLRKRSFLKMFYLDKLIETDDGEVQMEISSKEDSIEDGLIKDEEKRELYKLFDMLPDKYKNILILRYAENLSYKEIAEIAGLPIGTVETHIFRGHKLLIKMASKK